jgi:hypothetical protein
MKEYYDYMRIPIKGSSNYWEIIGADYQSYNVYNLNVDAFPS